MKKEVNENVVAVIKAASVEPEKSNGANNQPPTENKEKKSGKKKQKSPEHKTKERIRGIIKHQLVKDAPTKQKAVEQALSELRHESSYNRDTFLSDYVRLMFRLLDSKRFERDCNSHGLVPYNVATHIALESQLRVYAVLDNGIKAEFHSSFSMMNEPIFEMKDLEQYDTEGILKEMAPSEQKTSAEPSESTASSKS